MNAILNEHDLRGAVERMAAGAATPPMPGTAILAAGSRRRARRRAGAVGALALAATLAVSVSWSAFGGGGSAPGPASATTTNAFTEQLGHTLEQVLPGAKVTASMFTDGDPTLRHRRDDVFPLRIAYHGRVSDAFLTLQDAVTAPDYRAARLCDDQLPWQTTRTGCVAKDLPDGGILQTQLVTGPTAWTSRSATVGVGDTVLTTVQGNVYDGGTWAMLRVRGGAHGNDSGLTPAMVSKALANPRFTAFLGDFAAHPERDPYGPLAPIRATVVASGTVGTHKWAMSFAVVSESMTDGRVNDNCDYWDMAVDGTSVGDVSSWICKNDSGTTVHNPPPTDARTPYRAQDLHAGQRPGKQKGDVIGSYLGSTVPLGTATVEARFDDQPATLTARTFTVHGDVPYFALVKPESAKPDWKTATVRCLDADGKEIGKLYFAVPPATPKI